MNSDRRRFLKVVAAAPLVSCSSSSSGDPVLFGDVPAGNVAATAVGSLSVLPNAPAVLGRDAQGLYAMTNVCTHRGCGVVVAGSLLACPCHGSSFDANGNVVQGPASAPLVHFPVTVDMAGNITVHGASEVPASTRTAVG